jgi:cytochrome c-type biogenesis protein CcmH
LWRFLILLAFLRPRAGASPAAAYDLQVYRDQLKEVDRDVERGILTEAEAARARTEVSRRILEADRALQEAEAADSRRGAFDRWIIAGGLVAVVAAPSASISRSARRAIPTCRWPHASRSSTRRAPHARPGGRRGPGHRARRRAAEQPEREALVAQLRTIMEQRPDDAQGMALLASNEAALGNFRAARLAQESVDRPVG